MGRLQGKVLVIIGGTGGLGRAACEACLRAGAKIVVVGRSKDGCRETERLGDSVKALAGDARQPDVAESAIALAEQAFGDFHGLYHVAGGSGRRWGDGPLHALSDEGWQQTLDWNLNSVFYSNRAAVRRLTEKGGGSILNMATALAIQPAPQHFCTHAYSAAKSAIIGLTRSAAARYAADNVRFNAVAPALVDTPMATRAVSDDAIQRYVRRRQPLDGGRVGAASDLDGAVVFLMSDESRFVTGQVLGVDGGWSVCDAGSEA